MASIFLQSDNAPAAVTRPSSWHVALVQSLICQLERLGARRRLHRDHQDLLSLDDRVLADIGLTRDDANHIARHGRLPDRAAERSGR